MNLIKIIFILFSVAGFAYGKPEPLTPSQKRDVVHWGKLYDAISAGNADEIIKQWKSCVDKDIDPHSAVHAAETVESVKVLEKLGVDVTKPYPLYPFNKIPGAETLLQTACLNGFDCVVAYLLTKDPTAINRTNEETGCSLLHIALIGRSLSFSVNDRSDLVKLLIGRGAKLNAVDKDGETALMAAALRANAGSFKVLVDAGACDTIKNKKGESVDDLLRDLKKREDCLEEATKMEKILVEKRNQRAKTACTLEMLNKADAVFGTSLALIPTITNAANVFERSMESNILFARIEVSTDGIPSLKKALGDDSPVSPPYVGPWSELRPNLEGWDAASHAVHWAGGKNNDKGNLDATVSLLNGRDVIYIYAVWYHNKMPN